MDSDEYPRYIRRSRSPPPMRVRSRATSAYPSRRQSTKEYQENRPYEPRTYIPQSRKSTADSAPRVPNYFKVKPRSKVRIDDASPISYYPAPPPDDYPPSSPVYDRPRHRRSKHRSHRVYYSSEDDSASDIAASVHSDASEREGPSAPLAFAYSFTPSRAAKTESSLDTGNGVEEDSSSVAREVHVRRGERPPTVAHIVRSQYTGKNSLGESHSAELTEATAPSGPAQPIFRWIHYNWQSMDFDAFTSEVAHTSDLTSAERKGLVDMLKEVKRQSVKTIETSRGRHVSYMKPSCVREYLPADNTLKGQTVNPRTVTWVCLPYFTLEKYSGLEGGASSGAFPVQTLLQAQFTRVARSRDLQQVVARNKQVPSGFCYHIAQLWCLVLDNSVLFTCSRVSDSALCRDTIKKSISQVATEKPKSNILVSYKGSLMWSIPIHEAQTWLDFLRHFSEMWPRNLVFLRQKRQLSPEEWPKIVNLASRTTVFLDLQLGNGPDLPARGVLKQLDDTNAAVKSAKSADPEPSKTPESSTPQPAPKVDAKSVKFADPPSDKAKPRGSPASTPRPRPFSIFSCLEGVTKPSSEDMDEGTLREQLQEVEDFILQKTSFSDRKAYKDCPGASRASFHAAVEKLGSDLAQRATVTPSERRVGECQVDIFNAADAVFRFFFPSGCQMPTEGKYWGALKQLLDENSSAVESDSDGFRTSTAPAALRIRTELRDLAATMTAFDDILKHTTLADRAAIEVPATLLQGWIHLLMALLYILGDPFKSERLLDDAKTLINEGLGDLVGSMGSEPLVERSVVLPLEIVSLVSLELLQNATPEYPSVSETYSSYLGGIESDIATKTLDRLYERRLALFRQEVTIVQNTLDNQRSVFEALAQYAHSSPRHHPLHSTHRRLRQADALSRTSAHPLLSKPIAENHHTPIYFGGGHRSRGVNPVEAGAFRELLLEECLHKVDRLKGVFAGLQYQAQDLEESNRNMIDRTKDRQERAIYAFTIVTVIFLPLSSVASIFGMNTADVRDMELGQWAYWVAAVPVTLAVMFLGLLFTGELGNLARWGRDWWGGERDYDAAAAGVGGAAGNALGARYGWNPALGAFRDPLPPRRPTRY